LRPRRYLRAAKNGVLQYVFVKVMCAALTWMLEAGDVYVRGTSAASMKEGFDDDI
jgi:hypothetical protein